MRIVWRLQIAILATTALLLSGSALAQSGNELEALQQEVEAIRAGQEQMQKDLDEIKKLLQQGARAAPGQQPFAPTDMTLEDPKYRGHFDAPVTMVEFSDYQCPFCKRHANSVMPNILQEYVDTGKVRFVMREFPLENLHSRAEEASEAALCAGDQGKYWEMHDALFNDQRANTDEDFQRFAEEMGIDTADFALCMLEDRHMERINSDVVEGQKLGVSGTPSFVLGLTDDEDPNIVHLTRFIRGAQPLPTFTAALDSLIEEAEGE